jgi:hypothetical protein
MKLVIGLVLLFPIAILAQTVAPAAGTTVNASALGSVFGWFETNWGLVATILLGVSESLSLLFPSTTGFGGILASLIGFLKTIGTKPPAVS